MTDKTHVSPHGTLYTTPKRPDEGLSGPAPLPSIPAGANAE
jgi:hypothetical protein